MPEWKDALGGASYKILIKVEQNCKLIMSDTWNNLL